MLGFSIMREYVFHVSYIFLQSFTSHEASCPRAPDSAHSAPSVWGLCRRMTRWSWNWWGPMESSPVAWNARIAMRPSSLIPGSGVHGFHGFHGKTGKFTRLGPCFDTDPSRFENGTDPKRRLCFEKLLSVWWSSFKFLYCAKSPVDQIPSKLLASTPPGESRALSGHF